MSPAVSGPQRALATVDLGAIERNAARLPKPLCAVVKADAYGHGLAVAEAALAGGAEWLAVAAADEAAALRDRGVAVPILVMGAVTPARVPAGLDPSGVVGARPRAAKAAAGTAATGLSDF